MSKDFKIAMACIFIPLTALILWAKLTTGGSGQTTETTETPANECQFELAAAQTQLAVKTRQVEEAKARIAEIGGYTATAQKLLQTQAKRSQLQTAILTSPQCVQHMIKHNACGKPMKTLLVWERGEQLMGAVEELEARHN